MYGIETQDKDGKWSLLPVTVQKSKERLEVILKVGEAVWPFVAGKTEHPPTRITEVPDDYVKREYRIELKFPGDEDFTLHPTDKRGYDPEELKRQAEFASKAFEAIGLPVPEYRIVEVKEVKDEVEATA